MKENNVSSVLQAIEVMQTDLNNFKSTFEVNLAPFEDAISHITGSQNVRIERVYTVEFYNLHHTKICQGFNYWIDGRSVDIHGKAAKPLNPDQFGWFKKLLWIIDGRRYGYDARKRIGL